MACWQPGFFHFRDVAESEAKTLVVSKPAIIHQFREIDAFSPLLLLVYLLLTIQKNLEGMNIEFLLFHHFVHIFNWFFCGFDSKLQNISPLVHFLPFISSAEIIASSHMLAPFEVDWADMASFFWSISFTFKHFQTGTAWRSFFPLRFSAWK